MIQLYDDIVGIYSSVGQYSLAAENSKKQIEDFKHDNLDNLYTNYGTNQTG